MHFFSVPTHEIQRVAYGSSYNPFVKGKHMISQHVSILARPIKLAIIDMQYLSLVDEVEAKEGKSRCW